MIQGGAGRDSEVAVLLSKALWSFLQACLHFVAEDVAYCRTF